MHDQISGLILQDESQSAGIVPVGVMALSEPRLSVLFAGGYAAGAPPPRGFERINRLLPGEELH